MKPTDAQKKEISGYIRKWRAILYLEDWYFETTYLHNQESEAAAAIKMQTEYKRATTIIEPKFWKEPKEAREMIIVHELCHCITEPLVRLAVDAGNGHAVSGREIDHWKESVTQHITNAIYYGLSR